MRTLAASYTPAKPLVLLPSASSSLPALWAHHWEARNLHSSKTYDKDPATPRGFPISMVGAQSYFLRNGYACTRGKASSISYSKALTVRVQMFCGQRASSSQHILRRASPFLGSAIAGSLITYQCPMEHLQRRTLLSDLWVTCRITCSVVKTGITIIPTWQMSRQKPGATQVLVPNPMRKW